MAFSTTDGTSVENSKALPNFPCNFNTWCLVAVGNASVVAIGESDDKHAASMVYKFARGSYGWERLETYPQPAWSRAGAACGLVTRQGVHVGKGLLFEDIFCCLALLKG